MSDQENVPPLSAVPANLPQFAASAFHVAITSNEINLFLFRSQALINSQDGSLVQEGLALSPMAQITMSPQTCKDMAYILGHQIAEFEKQYGELKTSFLIERENASSQS